MTQEVAVDHLSWARRVDERVSVRLRLLHTPLAPGPTEVTLTVSDSADELVVPARITTDDDARVLSFEVDQDRLAGSAWWLGLRSTDGESLSLSPRLLAAPGAPVALLLVPAPATRARSSTPPPQRSAARNAASRVVSRLPGPARNALLNVRDRGRQMLLRSGR